MQIFHTSSKENFLDEVADYVIDHFKNDTMHLKIIMPNGLTCSSLQRLLVEKMGTCILPKIMPFGGLSMETEEIFKLPSENIGAISKLEEKLTIAQIIYEYEQLNYNFVQCLNLAPSLASLLYEIEANNVDIKQLDKLSIEDKAQHWQQIYNLIQYATSKWQQKVTGLNKLTRVAYQKLILDSEYERICNNKKSKILLAGIIGSNELTNDFISKLSRLENCHIISAPASNYVQENKFKPEDALYKMQKFMHLVEGRENIYAKTNRPISLLNGLISDAQTTKNITNNIQYYEFNNIFHEAEYIATNIAQITDANPDAKIAIITHTQNTKEQFCVFLDKYNLNYQDQFGNNILSHSAISLMINIANYYCSEFKLQDFCALLSHPLIISEEITSVQNILRKKNRFAKNIDDVRDSVLKHCSNEVINKFEQIYNALSLKLQTNKFNTILKILIKSVQFIKPNIWQIFPDIEAAIKEIDLLNSNIKMSHKIEFIDIFKQMLQGGRVFDEKQVNNILICRSNAASLVSFDYVFITDLNEGSFPANSNSSPWLTLHMQKELGLETSQAEIGSNLYDFYLNLHNDKVILTRSVKSAGSHKLASPFILRLLHLMQDNLPVKTALIKPTKTKLINYSEFAHGKSLPDILYATDIETLLRSPYNLYSKKILKIRKIEDIDDRPNLADFGNFFHETVEIYTKKYASAHGSKITFIKNIAKEILTKSKLPEIFKESWITKFSAIATDFIEFDEQRRKNALNIYSEIEGSTSLNIHNKQITIKAIADRIEIDKNNIAHIMDYKTGAIPTKQDVLSGLSPQLIIEAIILNAGGFDIKKADGFKLTYIKINSSKPYIKITEIELSNADLEHHKQGLLSLLEHYCETKKFNIAQNNMKYDDYKHLARR